MSPPPNPQGYKLAPLHLVFSLASGMELGSYAFMASSIPADLAPQHLGSGGISRPELAASSGIGGISHPDLGIFTLVRGWVQLLGLLRMLCGWNLMAGGSQGQGLATHVPRGAYILTNARDQPEQRRGS